MQRACICYLLGVSVFSCLCPHSSQALHPPAVPHQLQMFSSSAKAGSDPRAERSKGRAIPCPSKPQTKLPAAGKRGSVVTACVRSGSLCQGSAPPRVGDGSGRMCRPRGRRWGRGAWGGHPPKTASSFQIRGCFLFSLSCLLPNS